MKYLHDNLVTLVNILNDQAFHDGTALGDQLGMTRAAVWKMIKKLQDYGVDIDSVKGRGYCIKKPLQLLDRAKIKTLLRHRKLSIDVYEKVDSTNDQIKQSISREVAHICIAEQQLQGRGRLGRPWASPFGQNIYLSMAIPLQVDLSSLSGLSLILGVSLCESLTHHLSLPDDALKVKWPNDVYFYGKKLAGILVEIQAESHGYCQLIIGVGLNVNMKNASIDAINQPWTSLANETGHDIDRNHLVATIIDHCFNDVDVFVKHGLSEFTQQWQHYDYLCGKKIEAMVNQKKIIGTASGIDAQGLLVIKDGNNKAWHCSSGDTRLIKK